MADKIGIDRDRLARLLRNESDMAFKRRVPILMEYLELREGDRILDCGCGMGFYLKALSALGEYVLFGLDSECKPLHFARQELKGGAALVRGDILALPYRDESFDKVIMAEVLEHLVQPKRVVTSAIRGRPIWPTQSLRIPHSWCPRNRIMRRIAAGITCQPALSAVRIPASGANAPAMHTRRRECRVE